MTELEKYINSHLGIAQCDVAKAASLFKPSKLEKGQYFARIGERCERLSFVQSGFVRVFAYTDSKEVTQWISSKGYFIADLSSLIFGTQSRWNIQAITDVELFTIEGEDYKNLATVVPNWPAMEKQFISSCFITLENRVFNHLSLSAEERYDQLYTFNKDLFQHVPQQYLASMLGMTPETFSRIRAKKVS
ncbi:Crp/Fnr family transcriptional regulator [Cryomorphaceae bacterium 1068]|nr:Crp/Fnr family transcriptional regulator [Cryomorphaceae bacterium 1068]